MLIYTAGQLLAQTTLCIKSIIRSKLNMFQSNLNSADTICNVLHCLNYDVSIKVITVKVIYNTKNYMIICFLTLDS